MLEFLGFIALISIAFGISFGAALGGLIKFVVFGILAIVGIYIVAKMLSTKSGAGFVSVASIVFVVLGVVMINDDYTKRYTICHETTSSNYSYATCTLNADESHVEAVNKGWAYAICGGIGTIIGLEVYTAILEKEKAAQNAKRVVIEQKEEP